MTVVWQRGEVLQLNEIGYRDVDARLPMQRDTLFRIASMTKPVTVAAVMSLIDDGKLALKDPITRWAPEFADLRVLDDPHGPLDRTHLFATWAFQVGIQSSDIPLGACVSLFMVPILAVAAVFILRDVNKRGNEA